MLDAKEFRHRLLWGVVLTIVITLPYAVSNRVELRPVIWLSPGVFDTWIPINTHSAAWVYVTYYPALYTVGLLLSNPGFRKYVHALLVTTLISSTFFFLVPSGVPRDEIDPDSVSGIYRALVFVDEPRNAFPSEHASLALIAILALCSDRRPQWHKALAWIWLIALFWSTIATRQHVVFDLLSGAMLGGIVWCIVAKATNHEPSEKHPP